MYDLAGFHAEGLQPKLVTLKWQSRNPFEGQKCGKALVGLSYDAKSRVAKFSLREMKDLPRDATLGLLGLDPNPRGEEKMDKLQGKGEAGIRSNPFSHSTLTLFTLARSLRKSVRSDQRPQASGQAEDPSGQEDPEPRFRARGLAGTGGAGQCGHGHGRSAALVVLPSGVV